MLGGEDEDLAAVFLSRHDPHGGGADVGQAQVEDGHDDQGEEGGPAGFPGDVRLIPDAQLADGGDDGDPEGDAGQDVHGLVAVDQALGEGGLGIGPLGLE